MLKKAVLNFPLKVNNNSWGGVKLNFIEHMLWLYNFPGISQVYPKHFMSPVPRTIKMNPQITMPETTQIIFSIIPTFPLLITFYNKDLKYCFEGDLP